ncbi:hypothetical protein RCL1_002343 [Eukaryota sp. TZLM3-RCL]
MSKYLSLSSLSDSYCPPVPLFVVVSDATSYVSSDSALALPLPLVSSSSGVVRVVSDATSYVSSDSALALPLPLVSSSSGVARVVSDATSYVSSDSALALPLPLVSSSSGVNCCPVSLDGTPSQILDCLKQLPASMFFDSFNYILDFLYKSHILFEVGHEIIFLIFHNIQEMASTSDPLDSNLVSLMSKYLFVDGEFFWSFILLLSYHVDIHSLILLLCLKNCCPSKILAILAIRCDADSAISSLRCFVPPYQIASCITTNLFDLAKQLLCVDGFNFPHYFESFKNFVLPETLLNEDLLSTQCRRCLFPKHEVEEHECPFYHRILTEELKNTDESRISGQMIKYQIDYLICRNCYCHTVCTKSVKNVRSSKKKRLASTLNSEGSVTQTVICSSNKLSFIKKRSETTNGWV